MAMGIQALVRDPYIPLLTVTSVSREIYELSMG